MDSPATHTAASNEASTSQSAAAPRPAHPRSHRRKDGQPPRPPNAWICYRAARSQELRAQPEYARVAQSEISKIIARLWRDEDPAVRRSYELEAQELKRVHREQYPDYTYSRKTSKAPAAARPGRSAAQRRTSSEDDAPLPDPSSSRLDTTPVAYSQPSLPPLAPPAPSAASATPADYLPRLNPYPYPFRFATDTASQGSEAYAPSLADWGSQKFSMPPPLSSARQPVAAVRPPAPPVAHQNYPPPPPQHHQYPNVTTQMTPHYQNGAVPSYQPLQSYGNSFYDYRPSHAHRPIPMQPAPEQLWRHGVEEEAHVALPWSSLY
ncbi:hypothetical protein JCM8115_004341 [Rhodotorula mucilaginosa]